MSIEVTALKRTFSFNGVDLPDPGPDFSVEEIRDTYAAIYPDISTAVVQTDTKNDDSVHYTFVRSVGTKG